MAEMKVALTDIEIRCRTSLLYHAVLWEDVVHIQLINLRNIQKKGICVDSAELYLRCGQRT